MESASQRNQESHDDLEGYPFTTSRIMKDIFTSCDSGNNGFVLVSLLIDFITPFLQGNKNALKELQITLDPHGENPLIDSCKFHHAMSKWTSKISQEGDDVNDFHNVTPMNFKHLDSSYNPLVHSTPRSNFGQRLLKSYMESGILNVSNMSTYSYTPNNTTGCTDKIFYDDQINELEYKNKKLTEDLIHVRQELANCADQNEILQGNLDRLSKRLTNKEKAYEELMKERKCEEDFQESLNLAQKQIVQMKHDLGTCKKLSATSKEEANDLKTKNLNLQSKIAHLNKMHDEFKSTINALQAGIDFKEQEIVSLQEFNANLQEKVKEHCETLEQYNAKIDTLKAEKKLLSDRVTKNELLPIHSKPTLLKSSTPSEYSRLTRQILCKSLTEANSNTDSEVLFTPSISSDKFKFLNYDGPVARNRKTTLSEKLIYSPQNDRAVNCTSLTATNTGEEIFTDESSHSFHIKTHHISSPLKSDCNLENVAIIRLSQPSPNGSSVYFTDEYEPENYLTKNSQTSLLLDSSEDDICSIHRLSLTPPSQHVSLQAEIAQATRNDIDHECDLNMKLTESENKILSLQFELMKHQNCEDITEKNQQEIECLKKRKEEDNEILKELSANISVLKNEISLGQDRETALQKKCSELLENLNRSKAFIIEIEVKLNEYSDLQTLYEELRAKSHDLETENSLKYIRIVELTMETDRLQEETKQNIETKMLLTIALKDKERLEEAKQELEDDLEQLKFEMADLETNNKTLTISTEILKNDRDETENEKKTLQSQFKSFKENAEVENRNFLNKVLDLQAEIKRLEEENGKLSKRIEDLLSDRENKIRLIEAANEKLISAMSQMRFLEEKLLKFKPVIEVNQLDEIERLKGKNETNQLEVKKLTEAKSELENKLQLAILNKKEIEEKLEELMFEKENWLTEKVNGEACSSCKTLETKLVKTTGFNKLAFKAHKLEQKVEDLEEQLLMEKSQNMDARKTIEEALERENKSLYGQQLKARRKFISSLKITAKLEREKQSLIEEIRVLQSKLTRTGNMFVTETDAVIRLEDLKNANDVLREARLNLYKSTLNMANSWNLFFENKTAPDEFWRIIAEAPSSCNDEVARLKHQVDATTILMDIFIATKSSTVETLNTHKVDLQKNTQSSKPLNKFTLKPATLILRPVSPDSSSLDVKEISSTSDGFCPDSVGEFVTSLSSLYDFDPSRLDVKEKGDFVSSKPHVKEKDVCGSNLAIPEPNLNTVVLEDLGILDNNIRFSEKEMEEKFTAIMLAFTIDNASLQERMRKQKDTLVRRENALAVKLADLLNTMKEYLTEEKFADISSQAEDILEICSQVSMSAGQFGALRHEHYVIKIIAIMINYATILNRRLETNYGQSPHSALFQSKKNSKLNEESSSNKTIFIKLEHAVALKEELQNSDCIPASVSRKKSKTFKKLGFLLALFWTVSFIFSSIFTSRMDCSIQSHQSYPWNWLSWDEMFDIFFRKDYPSGPPPT